MGQGILPKLFRCIQKPYRSDYHYASQITCGCASLSRVISDAAVAEAFAP